jgi:O6-methylguanine-DNA--protein-cysteine methyltransferase
MSITSERHTMSINTETAVDAAAATTMSSPLGEIVIVARAGAICEIRLPAATIGLPRESAKPRGLHESHDSAEAPASAADGVLGEARHQLAEYFAGRRREFELPL